MSSFFSPAIGALKHTLSQGLTHSNAIMEAQMTSYIGAQGLARGLDGINAAVPEAQTFAGSDVSVIFMIPVDAFADRPDSNVPHYLESKDLQTITISSTSSLLPVRRIGEKKPISYSTGARTFAGSMIFTVINKDPFMELFSLDTLNQSATNDGSWHIDSMPPLDCAIIAQNETGGLAVQVIHGIRFTNWGTTYSIDDMYVESSYTYIAEHVTPFVISTFDAAMLYGTIAKALMGSDGIVKRGTSEDRAAQKLNHWRMLNQLALSRLNKINLPNTTPLDAIHPLPPGVLRTSQLFDAAVDKLASTLMSVTEGNPILQGVASMVTLPASMISDTTAAWQTSYSPYGLDNRVWY
jgi:hypothetical protein